MKKIIALIITATLAVSVTAHATELTDMKKGVKYLVKTWTDEQKKVCGKRQIPIEIVNESEEGDVFTVTVLQTKKEEYVEKSDICKVQRANKDGSAKEEGKK